MTAEQNGGYELPVYPFVPPEDLGAEAIRRYPVVIAGGGLAGLTLACDLATRGVRSLLLDEDNTIGVRGASSRGICYSQKSLEIFDRLGIYDRIRAKGVTWSVGRTFAGDEIVFSFDLQTTSASRQPPFINLQQFYLEWYLVDRIAELGCTDLRWCSRVMAVEEKGEAVRLTVRTPQGDYRLDADWLVDATGVHSPIREAFGLDPHFAKAADRWCITDVRFKTPLPAERWTWIEAPFNENRAVWQHLMADGVWRLDYQMMPDCDPDHVSRREVAEARLRAHLGPDVEFELVWVGPYGYRDLLLEHFRHGRVFFAGDAAHVVSPFGARGGNTGIADAENLAWKLALVLNGAAAPALLDSYSAERQPAAAENLVVTRRTNRFLAPHSPAERVLRDAVVSLAREYAFARTLLNTGRMSVANAYHGKAGFPGFGIPLQNAAITLPDGTAGCLVDLLRNAGTRLLALWCPPADVVEAKRSAPGFAALEAGMLPLRVYAFSTAGGTAPRFEGVLAVIGDTPSRTHPATGLAACLALAGIEVLPGMCCIVRPDLYLLAAMADATPEQVASAAAGYLGRS